LLRQWREADGNGAALSVPPRGRRGVTAEGCEVLRDALHLQGKHSAFVAIDVQVYAATLADVDVVESTGPCRRQQGWQATTERSGSLRRDLLQWYGGN
jgi:hypothetical protein